MAGVILEVRTNIGKGSEMGLFHRCPGCGKYIESPPSGETLLCSGCGAGYSKLTMPTPIQPHDPLATKPAEGVNWLFNNYSSPPRGLKCFVPRGEPFEEGAEAYLLEDERDLVGKLLLTESLKPADMPDAFDAHGECREHVALLLARIAMLRKNLLEGESDVVE